MSTPIKNRYDFVFLFDVKDGNPNGDPDAGNLPRVDPETGHGLVTDVCLKRKVRNYVLLSKPNSSAYDIFIREKVVLNNLINQAHKQVEEKSKEKGDKTEAARQYMCRTYYDVRTFGAVMTTGKNAGQVRGPVQLTFARSVDPIIPLEHSITRVAKTTEERAEAGGSEMGRKFTIPYALYRCHGFVSAPFAKQTGFSKNDLNLFWEALLNMFDHDRSAARGEMAVRKLIIFKHGSELGNAPAHKLFELVEVRRKTDGPPRSFDDYEVMVYADKVPKNVKLIEKI